MPVMTPNDKVFVAGHRGLVGSAIVRALATRGYKKIVTRTRQDLDLRDSVATAAFLRSEKPDVVILAAAKVGGIHANQTFRAEFLSENLAIQAAVIMGSHLADVRRLIFLGSSCIYPRDAAQPMAETALLTGPLEFTNRPYALAKIAGLELVHSLRIRAGRDYFSVMPTNLYGPGDDFDLQNAHVLPALIRKFCEAAANNAPTVTLWGSGKPLREFLYSDDCAEGVVFLGEKMEAATLDATPAGRAGWSHVNLGSGDEVSIEALGQQIASVAGFSGKIILDATKPDGTPRKLLDTSVLAGMGWRAPTSLANGLAKTLHWFKENGAAAAKNGGAA